MNFWCLLIFHFIGTHENTENIGQIEFSQPCHEALPYDLKELI
jgi:hypothetical protein